VAQLRHTQLFVISGYRSSLQTSAQPRDRFRGGSTRPSESNGHINKRITADMWTADVRAAWLAASVRSTVSEFYVQTEPGVPKYPLVSALGIFCASGKYPRLLLTL
jgi:hypothetical protein